MGLLLLGLLLFLGVHSTRMVAPQWRAGWIARRGELGWKGLYALVSFIGFVLLVWGYGLARQSPVVLYSPPPFLRHLAMLLMLPVFVLLVAAYVPSRIRAAVKHPMLLAVKLWAFAHLLANGTLADVLLFGGFLVWAVADRISVKRRGTPAPVAPAGWRGDAIAVVAGLVVYALFVWRAHAWLIGVPLMPTA